MTPIRLGSHSRRPVVFAIPNSGRRCSRNEVDDHGDRTGWVQLVARRDKRIAQTLAARRRAYSNCVGRCCTQAMIDSATGTRTRVARVRAEYPNQLDYSGISLKRPLACRNYNAFMRERGQITDGRAARDYLAYASAQAHSKDREHT